MRSHCCKASWRVELLRRDLGKAINGSALDILCRRSATAYEDGMCYCVASFLDETDSLSESIIYRTGMLLKAVFD